MIEIETRQRKRKKYVVLFDGPISPERARTIKEDFEKWLQGDSSVLVLEGAKALYEIEVPDGFDVEVK